MRVIIFIKTILKSFIGFVKMSIEFSKSYRSINKFLKQYKDRAIMIRVTPAQAKLLIGCTQIGILNIDDLCNATGAIITKDNKIISLKMEGSNDKL